MRILMVGALGTVGKAICDELGGRHEIITAGRSGGDVKVDIGDENSIKAMLANVGKVDAIVAAAGHVHFGPLVQMTTEQFRGGLMSKLMGQVMLTLHGLPYLNDGGSVTLTSGVTDRDPIRQGANSATVNGGIGGFVKSAAIEMPRGCRINAVSPGLLEESAVKYDGYFPGHVPVSSRKVGLAYVKSIEGAVTGQVIVVD